MLTALTRRLAGDLPELVKDPLGIFTAKSLPTEGVAPLAIGLKRDFLIGDLGLVRHVLLDNAAHYDKRTPAFHHEKVRRFGPILSRMASDCADRWEQAAAAGEPVDAGTDIRCRHQHQWNNGGDTPCGCRAAVWRRSGREHRRNQSRVSGNS